MLGRESASPPSARKPEYSPEMHREMVAVAAYYRAEHRGFAPGDPTADWLEAEAEIEQQLQHAPQSHLNDTNLGSAYSHQPIKEHHHG